jgi:hypothetical protein
MIPLARLRRRALEIDNPVLRLLIGDRANRAHKRTNPRSAA